MFLAFLSSMSALLWVASAAPTELKLQQQPRRIFERVLDCHQEQDCFAAVDNAMIVGECQVIHRANHDLSIFDYGTLLGSMHAQDRALWWIDDWRRQHGTKHAAIGYRECSAGQFFNRQFAILSALAKIGNLFLHVRKR